MEPTDTPSRVPLLHRSALKAPGPSKRLSPPPQVTSTGVHFNEAVKISEYSDSSYPTPPEPRSVVRKSKTKSSEEKTIRSTSQIPTHGPVPAFTLPSSHSRAELEALSFQLASQLRFGRIAEEDELRRRDEPPELDRSPPQRNTRDEFPEFKKVLMGVWVSGADCKSPSAVCCRHSHRTDSPILEPRLARALKAVVLHPSLCGRYEATQYLDWHVLLPLDQIFFHTGSRRIPLEAFSHQPATSPRLSRLRIASPVFRWNIMVLPINPELGVTVYDVLEMVATSAGQRLQPAELESMSPGAKASVLQAMQERVALKVGPGFECIADKLLGKMKFMGLSYDPQSVDTDEVLLHVLVD